MKRFRNYFARVFQIESYIRMFQDTCPSMPITIQGRTYFVEKSTTFYAFFKKWFLKPFRFDKIVSSSRGRVHYYPCTWPALLLSRWGTGVITWSLCQTGGVNKGRFHFWIFNFRTGTNHSWWNLSHQEDLKWGQYQKICFNICLKM